LHRESRKRPPRSFSRLTCSLQPRSRRCLPRHRFFRGPFPKAGARSQVSPPRPHRLWLGSTKATSALSLAFAHSATTPSARNDSTTGSRFLARASSPFSLLAPRSHASGHHAQTCARGEKPLSRTRSASLVSLHGRCGSPAGIGP
jgi:hypothetical protein